MILQGVLDRSLGNFTCLRGFAPLGELYKISEPDPSYQRDLIGHQQERMEKFLDDAEYLFFPEVILGASLDGGDSVESVNRFNSYVLNNLKNKSVVNQYYAKKGGLISMGTIRTSIKTRLRMEREAINGVNIPKSQRWLLEDITFGRE